MEYSEKCGQNVDEAVKLALEDLGATIDEVDVTVLEEPSRGFFGIGSKLALVRVERKKKEETKTQTRDDLVIPIEVARARDEANKKNQESEHKQSKEKKNRKHNRTTEEKKEFNNSKELNTNTDTESTAKESVEAKALNLSEPEENLTVIEDHEAITFLKKIIEEMGLEAEVTGKMGKDSIYLNIEGKDSGTIIGKRGQTLDAIQYLVSLVVNKNHDSYTRVVVNAENYRAKREKTLEQLAHRLAKKVVKTRRPIKLEPMNPYERKIIHATLQGHSKVTTRSEGEDPYRRVIIELK